MKVTFQLWSIEARRRTTIAIDPQRVEAIEFYQDAVTDHEKYKIQIAIWWNDDLHRWIPPGTRVVMHSGKEYLVQGTVDQVTSIINAGLKS